MAKPLTVNEVVALADTDEKVVRKEVEYGLFGAESPPRFSLPALVYFRVLAELGIRLRVEDRRKIYAAITKGLSGTRKPSTVEGDSTARASPGHDHQGGPGQAQALRGVEEEARS